MLAPSRDRQCVKAFRRPTLGSFRRQGSDHSFATFDAQKTVTLQGAVKEFEWVNPQVPVP
jgi:hypothetical protein